MENDPIDNDQAATQEDDILSEIQTYTNPTPLPSDIILPTID